MDSMLVVCYSETGVARQVARQLSAEHGWPLGEVHERRSGHLLLLLESLLGWKPKIAYEGPEPGDFRTVILVSSTKAGHLAAPMRSFLAQRHDELKRVAIVTTVGSDDEPSTVAEVSQLLGHAPIHNATFTISEVEDGTGIGRIRAFGDFLQPRSTAVQHPEPDVGYSPALS